MYAKKTVPELCRFEVRILPQQAPAPVHRMTHRAGVHAIDGLLNRLELARRALRQATRKSLSISITYDGGAPTPTLCLFVLLRILCLSSIINAKL